MSQLPARLNVLWDVGGVADANPITFELRRTAAIALSGASGAAVATLLNTFLGLQRPIDPTEIRTSCGTCTNDPRPEVPVQIEVMAVIAPDSRGVLVAEAESVRLGLAALVLNWFEANEGVCGGAGILAVRTSLLGLGQELTYELDPVARTIIGGTGGDLSRIVFGSTVVPHTV